VRSRSRRPTGVRTCWRSVEPTSTHTSSYVACCLFIMVVGSPLMCIITYGTGERSAATVAHILSSSVPPDTSFTMSAPASTAAAATDA
jgi:hypothetical protein